MIEPDRRPIASRSSAWAQALAAFLIAKKVHPNHISLLSIACAIPPIALLYYQTPGAWAILALLILLRLLCNLLDGMCALGSAHFTHNPTGALYNEIPDRLTDTLFLIAAGLGAGQLELSLFAALFAALTAYVRTLGASLGLPHDFGGPQSKSQRMGLLIAGSLAAQIEVLAWGSFIAMTITLWLITVGSLLTVGLRMRRIAKKLHQASKP